MDDDRLTIEQLENDIKHLLREINQQNKLIGEKNAALEHKEKRIDLLEGVSIAKNEVIARCREDNTNLHQEVAQLQHGEGMLNSRIDDLEGITDELEQEIRDLKEDDEQADMGHEAIVDGFDHTIAELDCVIRVLRKEKDDLTNHVGVHLRRVEGLTHQVECLEAELKEWQAKDLEPNDSISDLGDEIEAIKRRLDQKASIDNVCKAVGSLEFKIKSTNASLTDTKKELDQTAKASNEYVSTCVANLDARIETNKTQLDKKVNLEDARDVVMRLDNRIDKIERDIKQVDRDNQEGYDEHSDEIAKLEFYNEDFITPTIKLITSMFQNKVIEVNNIEIIPDLEK